MPDHLNCTNGPDVANGVSALIGGPQVRMIGSRPAIIGQSGKGFQGMAKHVEASACRDHRRQGTNIVGIDDAHDRTQRAVGDACLGMHL